MLVLGFVSAATLTVDDDGGEDYTTIQDAIDAAISGDTIEVMSGTYDEKLDLKNKQLTINGAGSSLTTIDASSFSGSSDYALINFGNGDTISNLKLIGTQKGYGFKISHVSDITLGNIKVEDSYRTGIDLNTIDGATLNNIEITGTDWGFGLMILDSNDIIVTDITTSDNVWGGVSVQTRDAISDNIDFEGDFNVAEDTPLLLEQDPDAGDNYYEITNVDIPDKFNYIVYDFRDGSDDYKQWYYFETLDGAKTVAQGFAEDSSYSNILIYDIDEENYYVEEGMLIQDAIDAASEDATINVASGEYAGAIVDKNVRIIGEEDGTSVITSGVPYKVGGSLYTGFRPDADGAEIRYFTINCDISEDLGLGIYAVEVDDITIDSLTINNVGALQGITNWGGSNWIITNNIITDTVADNGGGIGIFIGSKAN